MLRDSAARSPYRAKRGRVNFENNVFRYFLPKSSFPSLAELQ
uniref:Uncharacterized protein n=1 Tax=Caudovirales sp. ctNZz8 TaxID=2826772 RepID=A0A8S5QZF6_9CAUD|nr:MAG TPA: hypothetical protein [Caudovirales sp. ctNZz8]